MRLKCELFRNPFLQLERPDAELQIELNKKLAGHERSGFRTNWAAAILRHFGWLGKEHSHPNGERKEKQMYPAISGHSTRTTSFEKHHD